MWTGRPSLRQAALESSNDLAEPHTRREPSAASDDEPLSFPLRLGSCLRARSATHAPSATRSTHLGTCLRHGSRLPRRATAADTLQCMLRTQPVSLSGRV